MKNTRYDMSAYFLNIINTDRFRTIGVDVNFRRKIKKDEITKRTLLKEVLIDSTRKYNRERLLVQRVEELFDLKIYTTSSRMGNFTNLSFKLSFLSEEYTMNNMNEESILFLLEILFNPNVIDNHFDCDVVLKCKEKIKESILSLRDNKTKYGVIKLLESMDDDVYSYNSYGYIEDLDDIDEYTLYQYYLDVLRNDLVEVFVIGNVDKDKIKNLFREKFLINTFKKSNDDLILKNPVISSGLKKISIKDEVNQTKFNLSCKISNLTDYERKYVLRLYGELLGGSSNSILFDNVREKNSLCYYINADIKSYDNLMLIYSGITGSDVNKVLKLVKKCMLMIKKGEFTDTLFDSTKQTLLASLDALEDSQNGIVGNYYANILVGSDDFNVKREKISKITREEVMNISKKIHLDTLLLLESEEN